MKAKMRMGKRVPILHKHKARQKPCCSCESTETDSPENWDEIPGNTEFAKFMNVVCKYETEYFDRFNDAAKAIVRLSNFMDKELPKRDSEEDREALSKGASHIVTMLAAALLYRYLEGEDEMPSIISAYGLDVDDGDHGIWTWRKKDTQTE